MNGFYYNCLNRKEQKLYRLIYEDLSSVAPTKEAVFYYRNDGMQANDVTSIIEKVLYDNAENMSYLFIPTDIAGLADEHLITINVNTKHVKKTDFETVDKIAEWINPRIKDNRSVQSALTALISYYRNHGFIYSLYGENSSEKACFRMQNLIETRFGCCTPFAELSKVILGKLGFNCICVRGMVKHRNPLDDDRYEHLFNGIRVNEWGEYGIFDVTSYLPILNRIIRKEEAVGHYRERYYGLPINVRILTQIEYQRMCDFYVDINE